MMSRLRGLGNIHILLASLMISGCASVQRAILDASLVNTAAQENSEAPKGTSDSGERATTGAVSPRAGTGESDVPETTASVPAPPERVCDRSKAVAVGMTVAQV